MKKKQFCCGQCVFFDATLMLLYLKFYTKDETEERFKNVITQLRSWNY
jgi:hypothetical protein